MSNNENDSGVLDNNLLDNILRGGVSSPYERVINVRTIPEPQPPSSIPAEPQQPSHEPIPVQPVEPRKPTGT